jgi:hypothetical protein
MKFLRCSVCLTAILAGSFLFAQNRVTLGGNQIPIAVPEQFVPMAREVRIIVFPHGGGPQHIFRYSAGDATVSFDSLKGKYNRADLPMMKAKSEEAIIADTRPLRWIAREMTSLNGRPCVHLEYIRNADGGNMHHDQYYVLEGSELSLLSYSSPAKDFGRYQRQFQKSLASFGVTSSR